MTGIRMLEQLFEHFMAQKVFNSEQVNGWEKVIFRSVCTKLGAALWEKEHAFKTEYSKSNAA